jgi:hypothetical protein
LQACNFSHLLARLKPRLQNTILVSNGFSRFLQACNFSHLLARLKPETKYHPCSNGISRFLQACNFSHLLHGD